jgi:hypothetical protein
LIVSSLGKTLSSRALPPRRRVLLPGADAARTLAVLGVERFNDLHSGASTAEQHERFFVVRRELSSC